MKKLFLLFALIAAVSCSKSGESEQDIHPLTLTIGGDNFTFDRYGGTMDTQVFLHNGYYHPNITTWTLSGEKSWCKASKTTGDFSRENYYFNITFTVDENTTEQERSTIIVFQCGDAKVELPIIQAPRVAPITINLIKSGTLAQVLSEKGFHTDEITSLKITGALGDEDFFHIREMENLDFFDISETNITVLPAKCFKGQSRLMEVMLPKNLVTIGVEAFAECDNLRRMNIPLSVNEIRGGYDGEVGAFYNCQALKSINIPAGIEVLERGTFAYCKKLETVTFAKNSKLKTIANGTVYFSYGDQTSYYHGVFSHCKALTAIDLPNGLKTIGTYAFYQTGISDIVFPASVENIEFQVFHGCKALKNISFATHSMLKTIGSNAFAGDYNLTTVDMSACTQVESIGVGAFSEDSSLELFKIGTNIPPVCENAAFKGIKTFSVLKVPSESVTAYQQAVGWKEFANISSLD